MKSEEDLDSIKLDKAYYVLQVYNKFINYVRIQDKEEVKVNKEF